MVENPITGEFTWQLIGDFTGCVATTMLIMRAISQTGFTWLERVPSVIEAYVIGSVLLLAADLFLPPAPSTDSIALCLVNGFGVAVTAVGGSAVFGIGLKPNPPDKTAGKPK